MPPRLKPTNPFRAGGERDNLLLLAVKTLPKAGLHDQASDFSRRALDIPSFRHILRLAVGYGGAQRGGG